MNMLSLFSVGVVASAMLAAQPEPKPSRQPEPKPATQPSKPGEPRLKMDDSNLRSDLMAQEKKMWEAMKAKDWATFESFLADDFTLVCPKGIQDRSQGLEMARKGTVNSYNLSDWKISKLGEDSAVVFYKAECDGSGPDGKAMKGTGFASTIWTKQNGKWVALAHQMVMEEGGQGR